MVHRIEEAFAKGDLDALDGLYAADMVDHNPSPSKSQAKKVSSRR
jgi:hypothetical protein